VSNCRNLRKTTYAWMSVRACLERGFLRLRSSPRCNHPQGRPRPRGVSRRRAASRIIHAPSGGVRRDRPGSYRPMPSTQVSHSMPATEEPASVLSRLASNWANRCGWRASDRAITLHALPDCAPWSDARRHRAPSSPREHSARQRAPAPRDTDTTRRIGAERLPGDITPRQS